MSDQPPAPGANLDLSGFTPVLSDDFDTDTYFRWDLWPVFWGHWTSLNFQPGQGVELTSYAWDGWAEAGFMEADNGPTAGHGYGVYEITASLTVGEGGGAAALLWPANNVWPGPEIDLLESLDPTRQSGIQSVHFRDPGSGDNQFDLYSLNLDLSKTHTYAVNWEPGRLDFYVDGVLLRSVTAHVPQDAADGGTNMVLGAEITQPVQYAAPQVSIHIDAMSYWAPKTTVPAASIAPNPPAAPSFVPPAGTADPTFTAGPGAAMQFVDCTTTPVATVLSFGAGDVLALVGLDWNVGSATWSQGTDPLGRSGATLNVDLKGGGHIDSVVTLAGVSLAAAQSFTMSSGALNGQPLLAIQG